METHLAAAADIPLRAIALTLILLLLAGLSTLLLTKLKFPYTIGLVLVGLVCSALGDWWALPLLPRVHLTQNLILYVFLPALVFDAAMAMDLPRLRKELVAILILAAPGVVFCTLATGALIHWITPLGWGSALLFGALISTTDPVSVIATFKELDAPERLSMLVDGESLFNDATAIVMFGIVAGLVAEGAGVDGGTVATAAARFALVFLGGLAVGVAVGWGSSLLFRLLRGAPSELGVVFSICAAYISFFLAQGALDLSGVMATVGAGIVMAQSLKKNHEAEAAARIREFWPIASFFANMLIFLFLGLTERYLLRGTLLNESWGILIAVCAAVLAVRFAMVFLFAPLVSALPGQERIGGAFKTIMAWGGLRGALSVGLAVSILPENLGLADSATAANEQRLIVLFTVAVVVFSLVVQGTTLSRLMTKCGLVNKG